jgi:cell division initiation protein
MDSSPPSQSILETLRTVEFRLGLKGYNVDEVDEYLEKAAVEAESLLEQNRQVSERLRQAGERIAQLEAERREAPAPQPAAAEPVADETLQRTLLLAQKFVDQTKRDSETEAAEIVANAEERARTTISQAEARAQQLSTEAEQRLRDEVTRLEGMRGQLATDVENMARHLESERNRLRATLSEVLKWVDENIQPANALMALRPRSGETPRRTGSAQPPSRPPEGTRPTPRPAGPAAPAAAEKQGNSEGGAQVLDLRGGRADGPPSADRG